MGTCSVCGETALTRNCNHCGTTTCSDHILPENHDCIALSAPSAPANGNGDTNPTGETDSLPRREQQTLGTASEPTSDRPTVGASKRPPVESSPDVALDGSIRGETTAAEKSSETPEGRVTLEVLALRAKTVGYTLFQISGFAVLFYGAHQMVLPAFRLQGYDISLPNAIATTLPALNLFDSILVIVVGMILVWVSTASWL